MSANGVRLSGAHLPTTAAARNHNNSQPTAVDANSGVRLSRRVVRPVLFNPETATTRLPPPLRTSARRPPLPFEGDRVARPRSVAEATAVPPPQESHPSTDSRGEERREALPASETEVPEPELTTSPTCQPRQPILPLNPKGGAAHRRGSEPRPYQATYRRPNPLPNRGSAGARRIWGERQPRPWRKEAELP